MNESILKALMRLFAIVANVQADDVSTSARDIVKSYLTQQLNSSLLFEYLKIFDESLAIHNKKKSKKRLSSNSVKVLIICEQINEELRQEQKILVLLQLLEFVSYKKEASLQELEFTQTVADTFNISQEEYTNCTAFIIGTVADVVGKSKENFLILINKKNFFIPGIKHIYKKGLDGKVLILHIKSTNMYVTKYVGEDELALNGHFIKQNWGYILDKGASIRGSRISPIYYSDIANKFLQTTSESTIVFTAKDVSFKYKDSENGIKKFNFSEETGHLIGVMGGSGAGKSTLLNLFNGNYKPNSGKILINGYDIHENKELIEGIIGFIPQDDLLIDELTVFQNLYYNSKLCFKNYSDEKILEKVNKVLKDLDLFEIKDLKVGDPLNKFISGGQRKRLNIALELVREPSILFVDEPTSGLSSMDSEMVMDLLKAQALKNKLVIINIHQPSSDIYKLFDKILMMDKGGSPIYYGNPIDAITYFKKATNHVNAEQGECLTCGNVNPEQVLQIIESKVVDEYGKLTRNRKISANEWYFKFKRHVQPDIKVNSKKKDIPESEFSIPNKLQQFKIFTIRDVLSKLTNKQYLVINFLEAPLLAMVLGFFTKYIAKETYIFRDNENIPAYIFMSVVVAIFLGLTVSAEEIIRDRKILKKEKFLNLSRASYLHSKIVIMFFISAIQTLMFVLIGNFILEIQGMNLYYFIILFTTSSFANMLGLNISAGLNSVVTIYILIPFILVPQLLLSGIIVKFDKINKNVASFQYVPFAGDLMTSRWAYEALIVKQFKSNSYQKHFFKVEQEMSYNIFKFNYLIPELLSKSDKCESIINSEETSDNLKEELFIMKNEIYKLGISTYNKPFSKIDNICEDKFNSQIANELRKYLYSAKEFFKSNYNALEKDEDSIFEYLLEKIGKERFDKLKNDYHNKSISDIVLNNQEINKFRQNENSIIQIMKPIYKEPESNFGRAHFYSSTKKLFGVSVDTFWFNTFVIWFTSLLMYITLRFDLLRKVLENVSNLSLTKIKSKFLNKFKRKNKKKK